MPIRKEHVGSQGGNILDYATIGADLAGLVTARDLWDQGLGVAVLEVRDRVGGRVENGVLINDQYMELDGQWIGTGRDAISKLTERYGLRTISIPTRGNLVVRTHDRLLEVSSAEGREEPAPFEIVGLNQGLLKLRRPACRLADDPAWVTANRAWLQQDLQRWIRANLRTSGIQTRFGEIYKAVSKPMIPQVALWEGLQQVSPRPSLEITIVNNGGLNQQRVDGGMATPCDTLAADLGGMARLGSVVTKVIHDETTVITLVPGGTIEARIVVLTLSSCLTVALEYDPPLSQWRQDVAEKVTPGNVIRVCPVYKTPFRRERGPSGQSNSDEGAVHIASDTTPVDSTRRLLMGFSESNEAGSLTRRPLEVRRRTLVKPTVRASGAEASEPVRYLERGQSAEQHTRGCHGAHFAPGIQTSNGPVLVAPDGCLYQARTEYSTKFSGYMKDVVRSGEEVAVTITVIFI